jgi:hypothetical protein
VADALYCPFVVLLQEQGADQAGDGGLVGKDADDIASALDLTYPSGECRGMRSG